jgi:hypothetical protein
LQPEPAFPNSIPVDITTSNGKQRFVLNPTSQETSQTLQLDAAPINVQLDPDNTILKEVKSARQL